MPEKPETFELLTFLFSEVIFEWYQKRIARIGARNFAQPDFVDISSFQEFFVYPLSTYDKYPFRSVSPKHIKHFLYGMRYVYTWKFQFLRGKNDIPPVRERFSDGLISFPPHDNHPSGREAFEILEIFGQIPRELSFVSDDPIIRHSGDEDDFH